MILEVMARHSRPLGRSPDTEIRRKIFIWNFWSKIRVLYEENRILEEVARHSLPFFQEASVSGELLMAVPPPRVFMFSWYKTQIFRLWSLFVQKIFLFKSFRAPFVSGKRLIGRLCFDTWTNLMLFWYMISNFSLECLPVFKAFALNCFLKVWSIRKSADYSVLSCHFLESHILLIQNAPVSARTALSFW